MNLVALELGRLLSNHDDRSLSLFSRAQLSPGARTSENVSLSRSSGSWLCQFVVVVGVLNVCLI